MEHTCFRLQVFPGAGAYILVLVTLLSYVMGLVVVNVLHKEIERETVELGQWQEAGAISLSAASGSVTNLELNKAPVAQGPAMHRIDTPLDSGVTVPVTERPASATVSASRISTVSQESHGYVGPTMFKPSSPPRS